MKLLKKIIHKLLYLLPVNNNKIVFNASTGNGYGCNPKYIAEEIVKEKLPYKLIWLYDKSNNVKQSDFPKGIKLVRYGSLKFYYDLYTTKFFISNVRAIKIFSKGWQKKKNQIYIQTWHGSLGIKRIGKDVTGNIYTDFWLENAKKDDLSTSMRMSNSTFETEVYKNTFEQLGDLLEIGHPRNDVFFFDNARKTQIRNKVYKALGISHDSKMALFVPSFRDDDTVEYLDIDLDKVQKALEEKFNCKYTCVARLHPKMSWQSELIEKNFKNVVNATKYPDIQELLLSSDILITDYSSCIFDYMLSRNPGFIYANDIEKYNNMRGFYYPIETTPFPIATNNEELISNIRNFNNEKYKNDVEVFLKDKGCIEDGHASERVVEYIKQNSKGR